MVLHFRYEEVEKRVTSKSVCASDHIRSYPNEPHKEGKRMHVLSLMFRRHITKFSWP